LINRKNILIGIFILFISMSFTFFNVGHFLFNMLKPSEKGNMARNESTGNTYTSAVKYNHLSRTINGKKQEMDILEVDVSKPGIKIQPVLSFNLIYGFENLSSMAGKKKAYAAINGGFFYEYGQPSGMVAINGKLITGSSGKYPVFTVENGKAALMEIKSKLWLEYGSGKLKIDKMNTPGKIGEVVVYTPAYGLSNRAKTTNLTVTIKDNIIIDMGIYSGEVGIPDNGMLITIFSEQNYYLDTLPLKKGDTVKQVHEPDLTGDVSAYECGSWIIRDGRVVLGDRDAWVGVLTNRDPRTAIGIKNDGKVVLFTVDGRQPGYSEGLTGRELGEFLLEYGVKNAAMLDGGASTEMIVNNKIVNRPSFRGQERPLGGGILVMWEK